MYIAFWNTKGCFILGIEDFHRPQIPLIFPKLGKKHGRHHYEERPSLKARVQENVLRLKNVRLRFSFWAHMLMSAYGPVHHGYIKYNI